MRINRARTRPFATCNLLRRAAARYPLTSGEDRWDEIEQQLSESKATADSGGPVPAHSTWHSPVLLLLMLLPCLFLNQYRQPGISAIVTNKVATDPTITTGNIYGQPENTSRGTGSAAIGLNGIKFKSKAASTTSVSSSMECILRSSIVIAIKKTLVPYSVKLAVR